MLALALWVAGFGVARAEPPTTLVLIAPPTTLVDAVTTGLGPWQIRVVVVAAPTPADRAATTYRATYVATVRGTTLELFHVGEPGVQTRGIPAMIDDVEAASIALTLKTWMRLGPPPTDGAPPTDPPPLDPPPPPPPVPPPPVPPPPAPPPPLAAFASVGPGVRFGQGGFGTRERLVLAAGVTTPLIDGLLSCDLGSDIDVDPTTVWSEALIGAHLGHRVRVGRAWSLRPRLGVGAMRVRVEGLNVASGRTVSVIDYALFFDAAADVLWQRGPWQLGATAALTAVPSDLELRGQLRVTAAARVEPWLAISAGLQLP